MESPNFWAGFDGRFQYRVEIRSSDLRVQTDGSRDDFESFLRLDEPDNLGVHLCSLAPEMEPLVVRLPGFRLLRPSNAVETFFCFLCTPNNHLSRIGGMVRRLAEFGNGTQFPDLERVAEVSEAELRGMGFGYRGRTIPLAARELLARGGEGYLESLKSMPLMEARRELMDIHGVGPKLADCIALYALHHTDAVPVDTHLWQGACRVYFPEWVGSALTAKRYDEVGDKFRERFGHWAGHAHLFVYFDNLLRGRQSDAVR